MHYLPVYIGCCFAANTQPPVEGGNAEAARKMSQPHAWLVHTYDGLVYLDKPAFYFKTIAQQS